MSAKASQPGLRRRWQASGSIKRVLVLDVFHLREHSIRFRIFVHGGMAQREVRP
jgi:hypothetical protein